MQQKNLNFLLLLLIFSAPVFALTSDKDQPIDLTADSADMNDGKGTSTYIGNVDIRQGSMRIQGDKVTVYHQGRDPQRFVAVGSVHFQQTADDGKIIKGRAQKVEYDMDSEYMQMTGDAWLNQGGDIMESDRITYDRVKSMVRGGSAAKGKQRVRMRLTPQEGKK
jgi:lipopolysaccharide export system protein LptA